jgi:X-Pro dipeptidyl-peptidase
MATPAAAAQEQPPPWLKLENGVSAPQFAFTSAIEEVVFVETTLDTDGDGARDRIRIRISRPGETVSQGIDVPVVFEHSPYRGPFGNAVNHNVDFETLPQDDGGIKRAAATRARSGARARADLPGQLDNYYVPRGYAVVLGESIGTFNSDGCPDIGGPWETLGTKAVIDWLNGQARGFDGAGNPVTADWTTGAVGMTGVSYNGTLPNQVATTGVEGLKTIIPVSAISSWYDYYRANGLVVAPHSETQGAGDNGFLGEDTDVLADFIAPRMVDRCAHVGQRLVEQQDRTTGDWSSFWEARDYLSGVKRVRASVFVVHGLNDWNVKTKAFAEWWYRLANNGVPRKIWLHNGGHGGESQTQDPADWAVYKRTENRWFDHWLFEVPNGIMDEPTASIEREDGAYEQHADWPLPDTRNATLYAGAGNATEPGTLASRPQSGGPRPRQRFVDRGRELDADTALLPNPDAANPNRLAYLSPELTRDVHISGTPWVDLRASVDNRNAANLTAVLVDYGPFGTADPPVMVTRGWLDPQNRSGDYSRSRPIQQGQEYSFRFDLQPDDYVFKAGHRIGLVVLSTDYDYTLRPLPGTELTVFPARSELRLPVVGGRQALGF